jgi:hypothetical protein
MVIVKPIISIILLIPYVLLLGMFSLGATFPDGTEIYYSGWII